MGAERSDGATASAATTVGPPSVRPYVALLAIAAATVLAAALASLPVAAQPAPLLVVALVTGMVVAGAVRVRVHLGGVEEFSTFVEAAAVPVIVLLEPAVAVAVAAASSLLLELGVSRRAGAKLVFNASWLVTGVAISAVAFRGLAGGAFGAAPRPMAAAVVASALFVCWNVVTFSGIVSRVTGRRWTTVVREELASSSLDDLGVALLGLLVAVLVVAAPVALPCLAVLAVTLRRRQRSRSDAYALLAAERDRFERTVAGSTDGVVLLDVRGIVEVWNPAMAAFSGITPERALGATLDGLGWHQLAGDAPADDAPWDERRVDLGARVLSVHRATVSQPDGRPAGTVLTVRDVSREAELARIREDLVSRISHELRTPLTSLEGFLEVLLERGEDLDADGRQRLLDAARRGSGRLSRLVDNLMVWAGIEARAAGDDPPPGRQATDAAAVLAAVLDELAVEDVQVDAPSATVMTGDADLRTILHNLVANAVVYGAAPVQVRIHPVGAAVELVVTDHGPGLPPGFLPQLYRPFAQASEGLRRTAKGLGLGLAIVRAVTDANGGTVTHEVPPGGGTRFTVTLPAAPQPAVASPGARTRASVTSS